MKLFNFIFSKKQEQVEEIKPYPKGFIDFETGRRVEIDLETRQERFVS